MVNLVQLGETLIKDPELRDVGKDPARTYLCAEFTVSCKSARYDRSSGTDVIDAVFVRVIAWEDVAAVVARLGQGAVVLVTGQLTQQITVGGRTERKTKVQALAVQVVRTPPEDRALASTDDQYPGDH